MSMRLLCLIFVSSRSDRRPNRLQICHVCAGAGANTSEIATRLVFALTTKAHIPAIQTLARIAPPQYAGGVIVGFYISSITFLAPRFGVGNAILFAVTAQLLTSASIDHFALAGATLRPLTTMRAVGLFIVVVGVVITQVSDRIAAGSR
jgi:transporter family-2 protein